MMSTTFFFFVYNFLVSQDILAVESTLMLSKHFRNSFSVFVKLPLGHQWGYIESAGSLG